MGEVPSKEQNEQQQGKIVLVVKKEKVRVEYNDGVKVREEKQNYMYAMVGDDRSSLRAINWNQKALGNK